MCGHRPCLMTEAKRPFLRIPQAQVGLSPALRRCLQRAEQVPQAWAKRGLRRCARMMWHTGFGVFAPSCGEEVLTPAATILFAFTRPHCVHDCAIRTRHSSYPLIFSLQAKDLSPGERLLARFPRYSSSDWSGSSCKKGLSRCNPDSLSQGTKALQRCGSNHLFADCRNRSTSCSGAVVPSGTVLSSPESLQASCQEV